MMISELRSNSLTQLKNSLNEFPDLGNIGEPGEIVQLRWVHTKIANKNYTIVISNVTFCKPSDL